MPDTEEDSLPGPSVPSLAVLPGAEPFAFPGGNGPDGRTGVLLLVNPALLTQRLDAKLLPLIARLTASWASIASDIKKPGVVELAYPKMPTRAMMQLRRLWTTTRADLTCVTAPVIVFHSVE